MLHLPPACQDQGRENHQVKWLSNMVVIRGQGCECVRIDERAVEIKSNSIKAGEEEINKSGPVKDSDTASTPSIT